MNGKNDIKSNNGFDLYLSIDKNLQKKAEELIRNKRAAIVAIDPNNGEILALASNPNFDPRLIVQVNTSYFQMQLKRIANRLFN